MICVVLPFESAAAPTTAAVLLLRRLCMPVLQNAALDVHPLLVTCVVLRWQKQQHLLQLVCISDISDILCLPRLLEAAMKLVHE
jgi:hypothetical protein